MLIPSLVLSQYPIINNFNTAALDGWTQSGQTFNAGWHSPQDICFNLTGNYLDNQFYYFDSPIMDHSLCDSIRVSFSVSMSLRAGDKLSFLFDNGGWFGVTIPSSGNFFLILPSTVTQYSFELNTNSNGNLNGRYCHIDYVNTQCYTSSLPVELSLFEVEEDSDCNHVKWSTESELNNDYFLLDVSYDGSSWKTLDNIKGVGNSSSVTYYHYDDYLLKEGYSYYRLTQVDYNGNSETYGIEVIYRSSIEKEVQGIYNLIGEYLGKEINNNHSDGIYIVVYTDGSTNKIIWEQL